VERYPPLNETLGASSLRDAQNRDAPWPELPGATSASLILEKDWLYVRFSDAAGGKTVLRFKRKDWWGGSIDGSDAMYLCMNLELGPALAFDGSRRPLYAFPFGVNAPAWFGEAEVDSIFLYKAPDGSLIVNYRTSRVFLTTILIGSHARWVGSIWWRYPIVKSQQ
jgi:hypothetical protein